MAQNPAPHTVEQIDRRQQPSPPIRIVGRAGVIIERLEIDASRADVGIELERCPGAIVRNNRVRGARTGIQLARCDAALVEHNSTDGNYNLELTARQIMRAMQILTRLIRGEIAPEAARNLLVRVAKLPVGRAVALVLAVGRGEKVTVEGEEGHGIQVRESDRVTVAGNLIRRGARGEDGINLYRVRAAAVGGNTIIGHGKARSGNGITIDDGCRLVNVEANVLRGMGQRGIVAADGDGYVIAENVIQEAQDAAIAVENSYGRVTRKVVVARNRFAGLGDKRVYVDPKTTEGVEVRE
jgi:hypothetical protein